VHNIACLMMYTGGVPKCLQLSNCPTRNPDCFEGVACNGKIRMVGPWENIHLFLLVILLLETRRRREHGRATPTLAGKP